MHHKATHARVRRPASRYLHFIPVIGNSCPDSNKIFILTPPLLTHEAIDHGLLSHRPALNEEKRIRQCLDSVRTQRTAHTYELIVSDSGSIDRTVAIAREYTDKVYVCSERGTARARNEGAKLAAGHSGLHRLGHRDRPGLPGDRLAGFRGQRAVACSCAFRFSRRSPKLLLAEEVTNTYYVTRSTLRGTTLPASTSVSAAMPSKG